MPENYISFNDSSMFENLKEANGLKITNRVNNSIKERAPIKKLIVR